jgi:hypothetical protein
VSARRSRNGRLSQRDRRFECRFLQRRVTRELDPRLRRPASQVSGYVNGKATSPRQTEVTPAGRVCAGRKLLGLRSAKHRRAALRPLPSAQRSHQLLRGGPYNAAAAASSHRSPVHSTNRARLALRNRKFVDSPLEGRGFEPSVPHRGQHFSRSRRSPAKTNLPPPCSSMLIHPRKCGAAKVRGRASYVYARGRTKPYFRWAVLTVIGAPHETEGQEALSVVVPLGLMAAPVCIGMGALLTPSM